MNYCLCEVYGCRCKATHVVKGIDIKWLEGTLLCDRHAKYSNRDLLQLFIYKERDINSSHLTTHIT